MNDVKFLIFTGGRMGSTNFMNLLNALPGITIISEPFNNVHDITGDLFSTSYIQSRVSEIFSLNNGIKHCWGQLSREKDIFLLGFLKESNAKVLFLHRTNVLQAMVSMMLSQQTGVWHKNIQEGGGQDAEVFEPIDLERLKQWVRFQENSVSFFLRCLSEMHIEHHCVLYEELFDPQSTLQDKYVIVDTALRFLGFNINIDACRDKLAAYIDTNGKLSGTDRYNKIPNILEIMETFNVNCSLESSGEI